MHDNVSQDLMRVWNFLIGFLREAMNNSTNNWSPIVHEDLAKDKEQLTSSRDVGEKEAEPENRAKHNCWHDWRKEQKEKKERKKEREKQTETERHRESSNWQKKLVKVVDWTQKK